MNTLFVCGSKENSVLLLPTVLSAIAIIIALPTFSYPITLSLILYLQDIIPESCKEIRFVVYRQENEMNYKEPSKASNLNMQLEMAKCIIPKKMFDQNPMLKVSMQVQFAVL